jgi:trans-2,3-dihydro-3-hydroxyanthranilate isomerase
MDDNPRSGNGRPSSLQLKFQKNNREITEVSVGGASVLVCQGQMIIPDGETKSDLKWSFSKL